MLSPRQPAIVISETRLFCSSTPKPLPVCLAVALPPPVLVPLCRRGHMPNLRYSKQLQGLRATLPASAASRHAGSPPLAPPPAAGLFPLPYIRSNHATSPRQFFEPPVSKCSSPSLPCFRALLLALHFRATRRFLVISAALCESPGTDRAHRLLVQQDEHT